MQPSPAQSNVLPQKTRPRSQGASLPVGPPVSHLLGPAGFCTQQSLQHLDLDGFSWRPSEDDMSSFRTAQDRFSLDHCPVIGKGRNGTKEAWRPLRAMLDEEKGVVQRKWEKKSGLEGLRRKESLLNCSVSCKVPFSGRYYYYYHHNGHYHHRYR